MARYQHLPIYADAYRLALHVEQQVLGFAAKHRPAIGADLRHACHSILRLIVRENSETDRRASLSSLSKALALNAATRQHVIAQQRPGSRMHKIGKP